MKVNMNGIKLRSIPVLLLLMALACVTNPAMAAGNTINLGSNNVWTVYAFGNAQAVSDSFRALANFAMSSTFQSLVSMVAVLGVLGVGASGGFNPAAGKKLIGYFVSVLLVCYMLFGVGNDGPLVVNAEVIDTVDNSWKAPVTIPAVVGIPASIISSAGFQITKAIEASFVIPTELKMSQGAPFNLAASMIADASQARITDPNLAASLSYYVQDCFTIGVARGALQATALLNSTNFLKDIQFSNQAVMVNTQLQEPVGTPGIVSCSDAWDLINNAINSQGNDASSYLNSASAWSKTPALSVVNAAADSTAQWASRGGITDGAALVKQAAVLSAFRNSYSQASIQTGNSEFLTGLAMTQAVESQRTSWITGAEIFNKTMGYIFAILQVFVYAIIPLVLCASLIPGLGLALLKNFIQILLWLAIWQPMLSIVNFVILSMQQSDLGGILSSGSTYGFTLSNVGIVSEKSANLRAAASFVGTMVPALAWAMVKGSVDFSRVIGSAVGENFAQGAANTMTTGNFSLNQGSMDSFTANKDSTAAAGSQGFGYTTASATGSKEFNLGGSSMPAIGGVATGISASTSEAVSGSGNRGVATNLGNNGSVQENAVNGSTSAVTGSGSVGGGTANTSSNGTGANTGFGSSITGTVIRSGPSVDKSAGGPSGNGPAGPSAAGVEGAPTPIQQQKGVAGRAADRISANVQGTGGVQASGSTNNSNQYNASDTLQTSGGTTASASTSKAGGQTGNVTANAGHQTGYQDSINENITGAVSNASRGQLMAAYMRPENSMTSGDWAFPTQSNRVGAAVDAMRTQDKTHNDALKEKEGVSTEEKKITAEVDKLAKGAHSQKIKNDKEANQLLENHSKKAHDAEKPAAESATSQLIKRLGSEGGKLVEDASAIKEKGEELLSNGLKAVGKQAHDAKEAVVERLQHAREASGQHAHPPAGDRAAQRAAYEAHLGANSLGGGSHPSAQSPAGQKPAQASTEQQRDREQQDRQLAAAAAASSLMPMQQSAQQPGPNPVTPQEVAQHVAAQMPELQQAGSAAAAPNPFSGEAGDSSGQLQGQMQLAEQRADRMGNQLRGVDGVLASADGRPASDLPELVNQARDLVRKT